MSPDSIAGIVADARDQNPIACSNALCKRSVSRQQKSRPHRTPRTANTSIPAQTARRYGLTERETQILGYLARGRSAPFIREELSLSKSTVATHIRHIYDKLGVHSKQELLSLLEREGRP